MENESAFPNEKFLGLTKLEFASIEIAKGMASNPYYPTLGIAKTYEQDVSSWSIKLAKELLKQLAEDGNNT